MLLVKYNSENMMISLTERLIVQIILLYEKLLCGSFHVTKLFL